MAKRTVSLGTLEPVKKRKQASRFRSGLGDAALALQQGGFTRPLGSGSIFEGFTRAGEAFLATRGLRNEREKAEREEQERAATLASALGAYQGDQLPPGVQGPERPGDPSRAMSILAQNPRTAELGFSLAIADAQAKREHERAREIAGIRAGGGDGKEGKIGQYNPGDYTPASFAKFAKTRDPNDLVRYEPLQYVNTGLGFVPVSRVAPGAAGAPIASDVEEAARLKAQGTVEGEKTAEARFNLPEVEASADQIIDTIAALRDHPGMKDATGSGVYDPRSYIAGTPQHDFVLKNEQIGGQVFLQAYQKLRGGGVISDRDAAEAKAAVSQLSRAQSTSAYLAALADLESIAKRSLETARKKADAKTVTPDGNVSRETIPNGGWSAEEIR